MPASTAPNGAVLANVVPGQAGGRGVRLLILAALALPLRRCGGDAEGRVGLE